MITRGARSNASLEAMALADGARNHRIAERIAQRMHCAIAGAMSGDDSLQREAGHGLDRVADPRLLRCTGEMQPAHDTEERDRIEHLSRVQKHVHDAGMRARAEDDDAFIAETDREKALVHYERVRCPL